MSKVLQLRRGTTAQNDSFTGAVGEVTVDTTKKTLRLHDGSTAGGKEIIGKSDLATVATSGSYADLSNKPSLATVATSGSYSDLSNKPSLATVATSGSYNDLSNKPSIPSAVTVDSALSSTSTNPVQNKVINTALAAKAAISSLAKVATSGSYSDLSNKPTIPTSGSVVTLVSSSYDSTTGSWYRKWSDGYIEQGGIVRPASSITNTTVTFPVAFSKKTYGLLCGLVSPQSTYTCVCADISSVSYGLTSFVVRNAKSDAFVGRFWYAFGY